MKKTFQESLDYDQESQEQTKINSTGKLKAMVQFHSNENLSK